MPGSLDSMPGSLDHIDKPLPIHDMVTRHRFFLCKVMERPKFHVKRRKRAVLRAKKLAGKDE